MIAKAPQIGFDRFIDIAWAGAALDVRAGRSTLARLDELLNEARLTIAAKKKTKTVLNRLWIAPRPELANMADRGVDIYRCHLTISVAALSWGMAIAAYPFFGTVAEIVGRLTALQGDCTSAEVHRRMSEVYGEREGTYRMTNMILQTQASWGAIKRIDGGVRIARQTPVTLRDEDAMAWMIEAALRLARKPIPVDIIRSLPALFPIAIDESAPYAISKSMHLEMSAEDSNRRMIAIRVSA